LGQLETPPLNYFYR